MKSLSRAAPTDKGITYFLGARLRPGEYQPAGYLFNLQQPDESLKLGAFADTAVTLLGFGDGQMSGTHLGRHAGPAVLTK